MLVLVLAVAIVLAVVVAVAVMFVLMLVLLLFLCFGYCYVAYVNSVVEEGAVGRGNWRNQSDDDLANEADQGLRGQGAVVESLRRHREATGRLDDRMWWVGLIGVILAAVGVILAGVQIWVAVRYP